MAEETEIDKLIKAVWMKRSKSDDILVYLLLTELILIIILLIVLIYLK